VAIEKHAAADRIGTPAEADLRTALGRTASVTRPGEGRRFQFVVDAHGDGGIVLRPVDAEARSFAGALAEHAPIRLVAPSGAGLLHAEMNVVTWSAHPRLLVVSPPTHSEVVQRRHQARVAIGLDVAITLHRPSGAIRLEGRTVDASPVGFSVPLGARVTVDEIVAVAVEVADGEITMTARVVVPGEPGMNPTRFHLHEINDADAERWKDQLLMGR
jgi:hypothetical protein